jgi:hypothetical protein
MLNDVHGADVRDASQSAREYVERERSWARSRDLLAARLTA